MNKFYSKLLATLFLYFIAFNLLWDQGIEVVLGIALLIVAYDLHKGFQKEKEDL